MPAHKIHSWTERRISSHLFNTQVALASNYILHSSSCWSSHLMDRDHGSTVELPISLLELCTNYDPKGAACLQLELLNSSCPLCFRELDGIIVVQM
jgi:hypothetical protein